MLGDNLGASVQILVYGDLGSDHVAVVALLITFIGKVGGPFTASNL